MSLLLLEGFDVRTSAAELAGNGWGSYSSGTGFFGAATPGRTGTNSGFIDSGSFDSGGISNALASTHATLVVGMALKVITTTTLYLFSGATTHLSLSISPGVPGALTLKCGATTLGTSGAFPTSVWHYLEIKATIGASGYSEVRLDGIPVITFTGNTQNGGTANLNGFRWVDSGGYHNRNYFDDVYVLDNSGSSNNDFLGDTQVKTLDRSGNGTTSQLVGDDGDSTNNYLNLSTTRPPATTHYNGSSVVNNKDTYAFADLTNTTGRIAGVQVSAYATKTDTGTRSGTTVARSGSTEAQGADHAQALSTNAWFTDLFAVAPDTNAEWTIAEVNAAEFGVKVR